MQVPAYLQRKVHTHILIPDSYAIICLSHVSYCSAFSRILSQAFGSRTFLAFSSVSSRSS